MGQVMAAISEIGPSVEATGFLDDDDPRVSPT
jgi:hypothetical protein